MGRERGVGKRVRLKLSWAPTSVPPAVWTLHRRPLHDVMPGRKVTISFLIGSIPPHPKEILKILHIPSRGPTMVVYRTSPTGSPNWRLMIDRFQQEMGF